MSRSERRGFLLWDHDGVLVDTERWYFEATRVAMAGSWQTQHEV